MIEIESLPYRMHPTFLYAGDAAALFAFQVLNDDDTPDTTWVEWSAQWRPSRRADDSTAIDLGVSTSSGLIVVSVTGEQTREMSGRSGAWDIRAFNADGEELTFATGETLIEWDVTR